MRVNFYAPFRQLAGTKTVEVEVHPGENLHGLIETLLRQFPSLRPALLDEAGNLRPHIRVIINGRDSQTLPEGIATPLQANDKVDFFPPIAGG